MSNHDTPRWTPADCAAQGHSPADHTDPADVGYRPTQDDQDAARQLARTQDTPALYALIRQALLALGGDGRVWVVQSNSDQGTFVSAGFPTRDQAIAWAHETEIQPPSVQVTWDDDGADGLTWTDEDGCLTVQVTPIPVGLVNQ